MKEHIRELVNTLKEVSGHGVDIHFYEFKTTIRITRNNMSTIITVPSEEILIVKLHREIAKWR